ncbi:MAG: hypothetical protein ACT6FC_05445 [Methanosarcinaceae archaeon]
MANVIDQDKLQKASDHLWYEIWMYQRLVDGMSSGVFGKGPLNNAVLEAFAIHIRALIHFFFDDSSNYDDVLAIHFFSTPDNWRKISPPLTDVLEKAKKRANKEIAHLTYSRQEVTPEKKPWEFIPIYKDLEEVVNVFINAVPEETLGKLWEITQKSKEEIRYSQNQELMMTFKDKGNEIRKLAKALVLEFMQATEECQPGKAGITQAQIFRDCGFDWGEKPKATTSQQQFWVAALLWDLEADGKVERVSERGPWRLV